MHPLFGTGMIHASSSVVRVTKASSMAFGVTQRATLSKNFSKLSFRKLTLTNRMFPQITPNNR